MEASLLKQTLGTMRAVIAPKVGAVQNIGEAVSLAAVSQTLMFSSVSSIAGFSGHANYCAANAAVDALASNDAGRGLPSMAVQWGAWASVGEILLLLVTRRPVFYAPLSAMRALVPFAHQNCLYAF